MDVDTVLRWLTAALALLNGISILQAGWKKLKPEVKKLELDNDSEAVEASNLALTGAEKAQQMLSTRISELRLEFDEYKESARKELERERQARRDDREYFNRRIKELNKEAQDYRLWAARLFKQVIDLRETPVPFSPSPPDSERDIPTIDFQEKPKKE